MTQAAPSHKRPGPQLWAPQDSGQQVPWAHTSWASQLIPTHAGWTQAPASHTSPKRHCAPGQPSGSHLPPTHLEPGAQAVVAQAGVTHLPEAHAIPLGQTIPSGQVRSRQLPSAHCWSGPQLCGQPSVEHWPPTQPSPSGQAISRVPPAGSEAKQSLGTHSPLRHTRVATHAQAAGSQRLAVQRWPSGQGAFSSQKPEGLGGQPASAPRSGPSESSLAHPPFRMGRG